MPNEFWAMEENALQNFLEMVLNATPEQVSAAEAAFADKPALADGIEYDGDVAIIKVQGVMRREPASPIMRFFGIKVTSYVQLIEQIETVKNNPAVNKVRVIYNTPGGQVDGVDEAYQAMLDLATAKDVEAIAAGMLASGGYYLASPSSRIISTAPTNPIGSIGVVVAVTSYKKMEERWGVKEFILTSKNAPNKAPDVETKAGRQVIQDRIDAIERIFYQRISEGRGVSTQDIAEKFGRGGLLVSLDPDSEKPSALAAGMIDKVIGVKSKTKKSKTEVMTMPTLAELLETDQAVKAEYDQMLAAALAPVKAEAAKAVADLDSLKTKVTAAVPFITGEYPDTIKALAAKVLQGEQSCDTLTGAVTAYDALKEKGNGEAAAEESAKPGDTPSDPTATQPSATGEVNSETDFAAVVAADKSRFGIPAA